MRSIHLIAPLFLCPCLVLLARAEDAPRGQNGRSDQQLLQGTWKVVKRVKNGQAEDVTEHPSTMRFAGRNVTESRDGHDVQEGTFAIDGSKSPRRITLTGTKGIHADKVFEAIYSIEGDTLKLAYSTADQAATPPAGFTGGEGEGLLVLERQRS